jgi:hypothetical protein
MKSGDFFHRDAQTPLHQRFVTAGAVCTLQTNFEPIIQVAHEVFLPVESSNRGTDLSLRLWVDHHSRSQPPWPKPYVRGLDHLVFAGFDSESSVLVDVCNRRVLGRFSINMGSDRNYWKEVIFPILMSVVAASVGIVELHCSCVVKGNKGYLLAGPSRSGKSTLAMALTRAGLAFLSDDRTFCSVETGGLCAWGLAASLKLRLEARNWFGELLNREPTEAQDGELILRFDPGRQFGLKCAKSCEPECLVFLERHDEHEFCLTKLSPLDAAECIDQELMAEPAALVERQRKVIDRLIALPCLRLQYGGDPAAVTSELMRYLERIPSKVPLCHQQTAKTTEQYSRDTNSPVRQ